MKKMIVLLLCAAMLLTLCACGKKTGEAAEAPVVGGWETQQAVALTGDVEDLMARAAEKLVGARYIPVALLATQVVAGTNYRLLCRVAPVVPDPVETYAIVTVYEDLQGNASITDVLDSGVPTNINELSGGWFQCEAPTVTGETKELFDKALAGYTGLELTPLALAATQVVAGTNYRFLCETISPDTGDSVYAMVTVYGDLNGNAEITHIAPFPV